MDKAKPRQKLILIGEMHGMPESTQWMSYIIKNSESGSVLVADESLLTPLLAQMDVIKKSLTTLRPAQAFSPTKTLFSEEDMLDSITRTVHGFFNKNYPEVPFEERYSYLHRQAMRFRHPEMRFFEDDFIKAVHFFQNLAAFSVDLALNPKREESFGYTSLMINISCVGTLKLVANLATLTSSNKSISSDDEYRYRELLGEFQGKIEHLEKTTYSSILKNICDRAADNFYPSDDLTRDLTTTPRGLFQQEYFEELKERFTPYALELEILLNPERIKKCLTLAQYYEEKGAISKDIMEGSTTDRAFHKILSNMPTPITSILNSAEIEAEDLFMLQNLLKFQGIYSDRSVLILCVGMAHLPYILEHAPLAFGAENILTLATLIDSKTREISDQSLSRNIQQGIDKISKFLEIRDKETPTETFASVAGAGAGGASGAARSDSSRPIGPLSSRSLKTHEPKR